ncbi:MAG: hypothetical protein CFH39_01273, partial [Alphaproteobacteria bacterium MarineAlpha10_Bin2]
RGETKVNTVAGCYNNISRSSRPRTTRLHSPDGIVITKGCRDTIDHPH